MYPVPNICKLLRIQIFTDGVNALSDRRVPLSEETPERLYCSVLPDVIVKGGDYRPGQVDGGDCVIKAGGEVKILPFVEGQSTTSIATKAKGL